MVLMNKSERIKANLDGSDKYLQVKFEQNVDFLEILSLKIDQEQAYQNFNSDYGVLIGRVIANGGIGVPNAKISIFIPLSDQDEMNAKIKALYPYKNPQDKNLDGKRYNLLPRVAKRDSDGTIKPTQTFGTFPPKEEIITNETFLEIYEKYYKYTTVTNNSGDYMIFGVPVGIQTVHMSVDITDIGKYSMTPTSMISNLGYSSNLFNDAGTKIRPSNDLADLPNIETQEISVQVRPFWGDRENYEIGITRQDFRIRATLINTFVIFGTSFTDGTNATWGENFDGGNKRIRELYRAAEDGLVTISIADKRIGIVKENIFSLKRDVSDDDANIGNFDPIEDYFLLSETDYFKNLRDGDFLYQIQCNRKKVITAEDGSEIPVSNDSTDGIFTEFIGFITLELPDEQAPLTFRKSIGNNATLIPFRYKYKFPQNALRNQSFDQTDGINTNNWRKQNFKFNGGKLYTISTFKALVANSEQNDPDQNPNNGFVAPDILNNATFDAFWNVGIVTNNATAMAANPSKEFPINSGGEFFGSNWINFCVHFHQNSYLVGSGGPSTLRNHRSNTHFTINYTSDHFFTDNTQKIVDDVINTKFFARSDLHYTAFVEVPKEDIILILNEIGNQKGFNDSDISVNLIGNYYNGQSIVPQGGGRLNGNPSNSVDQRYYFYRGLNEADCIQFLIESGIILI